MVSSAPSIHQNTRTPSVGFPGGAAFAVCIRQLEHAASILAAYGSVFGGELQRVLEQAQQDALPGR
jgi:hypothetical protein